MLSHDETLVLDCLDVISEGVPFTHPRACHLLYHLVCTFTNPEVVEVACGYGKTTLYLAAAAKLRDGFVHCVDIDKPMWKGRSAEDLLHKANLLDVCEITFGDDARWYLIELLSRRPDKWIDLAYIDATHTVEVDSFVALALWTHMRPSGILAFDDLDWVPAMHAPKGVDFSAPTVSHVRKIFNYISSLPEVDDRAEWGGEQIQWVWGFLRKRGAHTAKDAPLQSLVRAFDNCFHRSQ